LRCYCCDCQVEAAPSLDIPTGRYYCIPCLEPTIEEMLRLQEKGFMDTLADKILHMNPMTNDDLEIFFNEASEEEQQEELEKVLYGQSEFTRDDW
jgi:hypothetical protein